MENWYYEAISHVPKEMATFIEVDYVIVFDSCPACSFDVNYVQEFDDKYRVMVMQKLKSSKPGVHLEPIELQAFKEDKKLCVLSALRSISARQGICEMDNPNC